MSDLLRQNCVESNPNIWLDTQLHHIIKTSCIASRLKLPDLFKTFVSGTLYNIILLIPFASLLWYSSLAHFGDPQITNIYIYIYSCMSYYWASYFQQNAQHCTVTTATLSPSTTRQLNRLNCGWRHTLLIVWHVAWLLHEDGIGAMATVRYEYLH